MKRKTNFDRYLEEQMKDPDFAGRYQKAGEAWKVALQLAALRKKLVYLRRNWAKG